jgi:hypothetical protein
MSANQPTVMSKPMKLADYLDGLRAATTAEELEAAIQAPFKHSFQGRTWATICKVRDQRGQEICAAHPNGRFVPLFEGRTVTVCGETYKMGRGRNSTGARYVYHSAGEFVKDALKRHGMSTTAAHRIWDASGKYPHRCLATVASALAGEMPDPPLDVLQFAYMSHGPIKMSVEKNDADEIDRRATMPCECNGTLFDWGMGFTDGFSYVNWRCNCCARVFVEHVSPKRFAEIRQSLFAVRKNADNTL